jgi:hypothetical protein
LYCFPLLALFTCCSFSGNMMKQQPNSLLYNADTITPCPSTFNTYTCIPHGNTQCFIEKKYCLKMHSSCPIIIKGLTWLGKCILRLLLSPFASSICLKTSTWNSTIWLPSEPTKLIPVFVTLSPCSQVAWDSGSWIHLCVLLSYSK